MPEGEQTAAPADEETAAPTQQDTATPAEPEQAADDRIFSAYGVASAALGALSVAAIALVAAIWLAHRHELGERAYLSQAMRTAADWTGVLVNMNTDNVDASLQRLHDGTVGELNADFDAAVRPYREVVQRLKSHSTGRVEAVAVESVHHDPDAEAGARPQPGQLPPVAGRTDTIMVVATSIAENVGGKPQFVHWNLRLDVSDVDGKLLISRLGSIR